jgi:hypothetical protein
MMPGGPSPAPGSPNPGQQPAGNAQQAFVHAHHDPNPQAGNAQWAVAREQQHRLLRERSAMRPEPAHRGIRLFLATVFLVVFIIIVIFIVMNWLKFG